MEFTTSYSPVTKFFAAMTKTELKEFYAWFMLNLPYCIEELMQLVRSTPGFEDWSADESPESLDSLGAWFERNAQKRNLTPEEIDAVKSQLTRPIDITEWDLTNETKSVAVYVGMYYGQVALKANSELRWEQQLGSKKLADFGQPVITGSSVVPLNPIRVAYSMAHGFIDGTKNRNQLREAYDYWAKLVISRSK